MVEQKLERLEKEISQLKEEMISIKKMIAVVKEPIIIERLNEESLTKEERRLMEEALEDFRKKRKEKFLTLEEFKKSIKL
jgi:chromosome segregation ATPase